MTQPSHQYRGRTTKTIWGNLKALQELWGYRYVGQALEHVIVESHQRHLAPSSWEQDVNRAIAVLGRVKPSMLLTPADILEVSLSPTVAKVRVRLEADWLVVGRKEWDK